MNDDIRADLAKLVASLGAYVEWQRDTGAHGFPRRPSAKRGPAESTAPRADSDQSAPPEISRSPTQPRDLPGASTSEGDPHPPSHGLDGVPLPTESAYSILSQSNTSEAHRDSPVVAVDRHVRLPELARQVASCTRCGLHATRIQTVFSRGNADAALCFVGEAPGADEDEQGLPFVGRAGKLLDRMIGAMGLSPERDVYVCNIIKCRPPDNRRPEPHESATCISYLHEQLALVHPRVIVALGNTAVAALLDTKLGITKVRGNWKLYRGQTLVMPTYHPSYLLRPSAQQAEAKRQAWEDLQLVMKELGIAAPTK